MDPVAVQTYPGEELKLGPNRITFEPATGQAAILISPRRDSATHIQLLGQVILQFPDDHWLLIEDNLTIHTSKQVKLALAAWPEIQAQFIPKYACWLNLIEPWRQQLRSLALKGRCFETLDQLTQALNGARYTGTCIDILIRGARKRKRK